MPNYSKALRELAKKMEPDIRILRVIPTIRNGTDRSFKYMLECGHTHEQLEVQDYKAGELIKCRRCGFALATIAARNNPQLLNPDAPADKRPKVKFRTEKQQRGFLRRLNQSRAANSIERLRQR